MKDNPVFREAAEILFLEGQGFSAYFLMLAILAPIEFLSLAIPALDVQMWTGSANLFKVSSVTALLLIVYFTLRVANQEFASWKFQPMKRWLREDQLPASTVGVGQLSFLALHLFICLLLCAPLLVWAGAIARTHPAAVGVTFLLLVFYSLSYGVWGLVALALWERKIENRQVFVRFFFFSTVIVSALFYLPLNPVAYLLAYLGREELAPLVIGEWRGSATAVHLGFHLFLLGMGLAIYQWALRRGARE
jgi:hypothetical protein